MLRILAFLNTLIFFPMMLLQVLMGAMVYWIGRAGKCQRLQRHGKGLAIAADQNLNTIWLGHPDETVSSRTGRAVLFGRPKWYIKYLLHPFVDRMAMVFGDAPDHCVRSIENIDFDSQYEVWKWSS